MTQPPPSVASPAVVKYAFSNLEKFEVGGKLKWRASCVHCNDTITESRNTTSGFNK